MNDKEFFISYKFVFKKFYDNQGKTIDLIAWEKELNVDLEILEECYKYWEMVVSQLNNQPQQLNLF